MNIAHAMGMGGAGQGGSNQLMAFLPLILLFIVLGALVMFKYKPTSFIPVEDEGRLIITFELPDASSTTRTNIVLH